MNGRRSMTGQTTLLVDRQFRNAWDAYMEYAADFPDRGGPRHLVHLGTGYKPSPYQQIDFHVGFGLSQAAADYFIGVGYSFRLRLLQH